MDLNSKANEIAKSHRADMEGFGYTPSVLELAQHVWHSITPDERAEVMEVSARGRTIHQTYKNCLDQVARMLD